MNNCLSHMICYESVVDIALFLLESKSFKGAQANVGFEIDSSNYFRNKQYSLSLGRLLWAE